MARLPQPGADEGVWGDVLNDYLQQSLTSGGALKPNSVTSTQLADNAVTLATIADDSVTKSKLSPAVQATLDKADTALQSAPVTSVAEKTGAVMLEKADVGLSNVDNTSDVAKPISTATQAALDDKADVANVGAKVLLIDNAAALPAGTPAGVVVILKA